MPATILIISPSHDHTTAIVSWWAESVTTAARKLGHRVSLLTTPNVTRERVQDELRQSPPDLVVFYGHGTHQALYGDSGQVVIDAANAPLLSNCVTYAVACQAGVLLASTIGRQLNGTCIAYHQIFCVPLDEPFRSVFGVAVNSVAFELIEGHTAERSVATGHEEFHKLYCDLSIAKSAESEHWATQAAICVSSLECRGYELARLS